MAIEQQEGHRTKAKSPSYEDRLQVLMDELHEYADKYGVEYPSEADEVAEQIRRAKHNKTF